jgi:uncharacterized Zn-finger protein
MSNNEIMLPLCPKKYICSLCQKEYNDNSGLWRHKKKCEKNMDKEKKVII